jgi:TonB family protein
VTHVLRLLIVFLLVCATTDASTSVEKVETFKPNNLTHYVDLTTKDGVILTLEEQEVRLKKYWQVFGAKRYVYKKDRAKRNLSGCVQFLITLNEEGKISSYGLLKSYPKDFFDKRAIQKLKALRWQAAEENNKKLPVLTSIQLEFGSYKAKKNKEANKECKFRTRFISINKHR